MMTTVHGYYEDGIDITEEFYAIYRRNKKYPKGNFGAASESLSPWIWTKKDMYHDKLTKKERRIEDEAQERYYRTGVWGWASKKDAMWVLTKVVEFDHDNGYTYYQYQQGDETDHYEYKLVKVKFSYKVDYVQEVEIK